MPTALSVTIRLRETSWQIALNIFSPTIRTCRSPKLPIIFLLLYATDVLISSESKPYISAIPNTSLTLPTKPCLPNGRTTTSRWRLSGG